MITTEIVFDHYGRTQPGKEGPLEVRIIISRKPYYISTGIKVRKSEYRFGTIINRPDSDILNARLSIIVRRIEEEINKAVDEGAVIDVADIRRKAWVTMVDDASTSLLDWLGEQVDNLTLKEGTVKHYRTLITRMEDCGIIKRWGDLTAENICKFDSWLHGLKKPLSDAEKKSGAPEQLLSDAAIYNYHKCLKALLNKAVIFDRIPMNPYMRLRGKFKRGDREKVDYLTDEEMTAIMSLQPVANTEMAVARDLFVFQMFTGLSFSDSQSFDIRDYKLIDGTWRNMGERIKTGVPYTSQLLPPVVSILEKYGMKVPKIQLQHYNECLKSIGSACGIGRPLHSHIARHTFATYMLRNGVPIEHVSRMLGHTNIMQTQRYAKIVAKDIHDDFSRIAKLLK